MKILVGILYSIEKEYEQCISAINKQKEANFDTFLIKNLPNKEAHDQLYARFMANRDNYDLFIKIDADMVLAKNRLFRDIAIFFSDSPNINHYTIPVHDHFTNRLIYGLHVYRNCVAWCLNNDNIFVDRLETNTKQHLDDGRFTPAAFHAPSPSLFQAFHFGIHKAIKFTQYNTTKYNFHASIEHWQNIRYLFENYKNKKNSSLLYALIGTHYAIKYKLQEINIDFNDPKSLYLFNSINKRFNNKYTIISTYLHSQIICSKLYLALHLKINHNIPIMRTIKQLSQVTRN